MPVRVRNKGCLKQLEIVRDCSTLQSQKAVSAYLISGRLHVYGQTHSLFPALC